MKLDEAKSLTLTLMSQHNLTEWSFKFDNAKRRFGSCDSRLKEITLSKHLVLINDENRVKNTILHEIAHALVGCKHHHDNVWKQKALEIGCNGNRCYNSKDTVRVEGTYQAACSICGHIFHSFKLRKKQSSCGLCSTSFNKEAILIFVKK